MRRYVTDVLVDPYCRATRSVTHLGDHSHCPRWRLWRRRDPSLRRIGLLASTADFEAWTDFFAQYQYLGDGSRSWVDASI